MPGHANNEDQEEVEVTERHHSVHRQADRDRQTDIETDSSLCSVSDRAVPNILFVFYSVRIVGRIVYSYSAE